MKSDTPNEPFLPTVAIFIGEDGIAGVFSNLKGLNVVIVDESDEEFGQHVTLQVADNIKKLSPKDMELVRNAKPA